MPGVSPELLAYLLAQCSADVHLHCGPQGAMYRAPIGGPPVVGGFDELHRCPAPCPETDYSNPNQPYFWDHTEMN